MYKIMTAGPTQVRENVRSARSFVTTNPDLDEGFFDFYKPVTVWKRCCMRQAARTFWAERVFWDWKQPVRV